MTDTLIVGGGNAGLAAAVTAGELGLDTIVLEKTNRLGGQLHWSSGHFSAAGTGLQHRCGIFDTAEEHKRDVERLAHGRGTPALIELATREAAEAVDWLEGLGFPFSAESPALVSGHELYGKARTYWGGDDPRTGGIPIMETLVNALETHSSVSVIFGTARKDLIVEDRTVRGIVTTGGHEIRASRTILATGGYAASRDLIADLQPSFTDALTGCLPHAAGEGLQALRRLGVPVVAADTYVPTMGMIPDPDKPGFGIPLHVARYTVNAADREPWEIWVDPDGRRFVDEGTKSPFVREQALMGLPGLRMAAVWDEAIFEAAPPVIGPDWTRQDMIDESERGKWLHRCNTLAELADRLAVSAGGLRSTVAEWNSGFDSFGRAHRPRPVESPPFWGVISVGGMLLSRGGPAVDGDLRPVDANGAPIDGVHCVGELLGMGQFSGDNFAGGMSVGPALTLGRWIVRLLWERGAFR
jgi:fumarate reductase flavoprotein subunit